MMEQVTIEQQTPVKGEVSRGGIQPLNLSLVRSGSNTPNQEEHLSVDHQKNDFDKDEVIAETASARAGVKTGRQWRPPFNYSDCLVWCKFTLFPCCLLGNITSEFEREPKCSFMQNSLCQDCAMGSKGFFKCLCISILAFPCSPCLSCYLLRERWKLKLFYPYDDRLRSLTSICDYCYYGCCWMKNLQEQHVFIHALQDEGNLTFAWDYALYRDYLPKYRNLTPPSSSSSSTFFNSATIVPAKLPYDNPTLLVFGPNTSLKQQFLRKLLMQTNNKELNELNKHYPLLQETHHIQTGVRSILTEEQELKFLEVWDIPINHFYSSFIPRLQDETFVSLYLFDLNDAINFQEMKKIFAHYEFLSHKPRIIIVLKDNPMNMLVPATIASPTPPTQSLANASFSKLKIGNQPNHSIYASNNSSSEALLVNQSVDKVALEAEILTWARRQGVLWYHISVFDEYNYLVLNKQIIKLLPKRPHPSH